jgi:hypothetical protein
MFHETAEAHFFVSVETLLPVNDYLFKGVHLWPLIRVELHSRLINARLKEASPETIQRLAALGEAVLASHVLRQPDRRFEKPPPARTLAKDLPVTLFYTRFDEHYRVTLDGRYAPILDPWFDIAKEFGPALKIEQLSDGYLSTQPRRNATFSFPPPTQAMIDAARSEVVAEGWSALSSLLSLVNAFSIERFGLDLSADLPELAGAVVTCLAYKYSFEPFLAAARPSTLFLTCFYHSAGMAILWACHDAGVRTVEIQHCVNGETQPPYTHWTSVPADNYAIFPDCFLTWGEISANNINRWLKPGGREDRVVCGGRPDLSLSSALDPSVEAIESLCRDRDRIILVSMDYSPFAPALLAAMQQAPDDWLWLIRSHPWAASTRMKDACPDDLQELLRREGLKNFDTHLTTTAFLPTLLARIDHHVTRISSVALEAFSFDVPTTFIYPTAHDLYGTYIERHQAYYADRPDAIIDSIAKGWSGLAPDRPKDIVTDSDTPRRVMQALLTTPFDRTGTAP